MSTPNLADVRCINCDETLAACDEHGCGGTKELNWRVKLIAEGVFKRSPKLRVAQDKALAALLLRKEKNVVRLDDARAAKRVSTPGKGTRTGGNAE